MDKQHRQWNVNQNSEESVSPSGNQSVDNIWKKLKRKAEQVGYGSLICEIQVHQGEIRQVDITTVKERMRAD